MNRGEGLRIAAKAKSGSSVGHMFQEKRTKPKKFGYKSKTQSFPVRKNIHGIIDDGNQQLSKTTSSKHKEQQKSSTTQNGSVQRQVLNQKNGAKAVDQKDKARSNFVDKNKKVLSKKEKILKQADTVTLTQDQLNAILKTIGTASESKGTPSFSIDAGDLKVNLSSINRDSDNADEENGGTNIQKSKEEDKSENISALITDAKQDDSSKDQASVNANHEDNNNNEKIPRSEVPVEEKTQKAPGTTASLQKQSPRLGQSDIINTIGLSEQNDRALMEKKKQQWKQELDAQLAAKKAVQEREGKSRKGRGQNVDDGWNPWGQPGGGAPLRSSIDTSSPRDNQVSTGHPSPGQSSGGQGSSGTLSQSVSGLSYAERQRNVPAAMRSSFIIGGITNGFSEDLKRKEKQQWLEDLERQKREAKEKKEQEKANQRAIESAVMQHWAEPVDHPPSRIISRMDNIVGQVQDDSRVMSRMAAERKEQTKEPEQPKSAPLNSSRSPHNNEDISPRLHIRPANALIDPAEVERREIQRKKHLEHMAFVQAQVEEKRRKKQEALALRRQEEAEEERKLAEERNRLAQDFEREQEKLRKKEEAAAAKQRALAESMQNAHDAAMREKHAERMRKLQRQGHDVSNLRKSWDDKHQSPEVSPRHGNQLQAPPKPTTSVSFSPRHDPVKSDVKDNVFSIQDAATSPIHEVSTQTDIDVLDANYISPRLIEAIRLASAGAEYKPKSKKRSEQDKSKQLLEGDKRRDKAAKVVSIKDDVSESKAGKSRKTSDASKPKWGQSAQGKKVMKNSDKDMSMSKKKREERLKKRQEELLALQEKSAPKRATQPKQTQMVKKLDNENQGKKSRADTKLSHHSDVKEHRVSRAQGERTGSRREAPALTQERVLSQHLNHKELRLSSSEDSFSAQTPPRNNDFVPFMRTEDDELIEGSLSVSPVPIPQRSVPTKTDLTRVEASRASRHSRQSHREMDPLLNPDRLKDREHRQEEILMQLSTLRQGLLMKQRELEIGLSPSSPVII